MRSEIIVRAAILAVAAMGFSFSLQAEDGPSLAILCSEGGDTTCSGAVAAMQATGQFSSVVGIDTTESTPTLDQISRYNAILADTNETPNNGTALGNLLASYYQPGVNALTIGTYAFSTNWQISGAVMAGAYAALTNSGTDGDVSGNLVATVPGDPIFNGINLSELTYFHNENFAHPTVASGATLLATDGAGINMIARSSNGVVNVNLFSDYASSGDNAVFYQLIANTLTQNVVEPLSVTSSHTGTFQQGQTGATYTLTVSNTGPATEGTVTVMDTLPSSLGATSITGSGWSCTVGNLTCTRNDSLAMGAQYPAITLSVNVSPTAPSSVTNSVTVSGGGQANPETGYDPTTISASVTLSISNYSLVGGTVNQPYQGVTLTASGGTGSYSWGAGGLPPGMSISAGGTVSGTPTAGGNFTVTVTVMDSGGHMTAKSFTLIIAYAAPTITTTSLPSGTEFQAYGPASVAASGGSGNFSWTASGTPAGVGISAAGVLSGTPTAAGPFSIMATVTDTTSHLTASATFPITIAAPAPLSVTTPSLPNGAQGQAYGSVSMTATGGSGKYSWTAAGTPPGVGITAAGVLSGTPTAGGSFSITTTVNDTVTNQTAQQSYTVLISFAPLTLGGPTNLGGFAPGAGISASYTATGGKPPYTYSAQGLPSGLSLSASGGLSGSVTQPGNYSFQVQVTDSQPTSTSVNVSFFVLAITTSALPGGTLNTAYSQTLDAAGGTPPYTWSGGPVDGLSLSGSGVLSGTPTATGTFPVPVSVSSGGVTVSATLSLTVATQLLPLSIPGGGGDAPIGLAGGTVSIPYSQTLVAANGKPPYTWSVIGGKLPPGLSLNGTGTLSGTPTLVGPFGFTAQVTDTSGAQVGAAYSLTISPPALSIISGSLPTGIVGADYPAQIFGAAGGTPPYMFQETGALPGGLSFVNGQITGLPTASGVFPFTVTLTDSGTPTAQTATASFQISIEPSHPDLILGQTLLPFTLNTGAAGLPAGASISVRSSVIADILNYSVAVTPAAPWLDVTGGGTTPGSIAASLDPSALSLGVGTQQTSIVVTCLAPSPCAGNAQTITVSLTVAAPPAQLSLTTNLLSFSAQAGSAQPLSQPAGIQNIGGGTITVNSITAADSFVTISGAPTAVPAGPAIPFTVTVNPSGLAAGYYQSTILVNTSAGSATLPVTLLVAQNATMTLNPAGTQFQMVAGAAPGNPNGSFLVSVSGSSTVNWAASVLPGASWLILNTASGSSTSASPGTVNFAIDPVAAAALAPQAYYGTIQVTSGTVVDSPVSYLVVLNVAPSASPAKPDLAPEGLVFIATSGATALPPQTVAVYASSATPLTYQASTQISNGPAGWLQVSPATGSASSSSPGSSSVSVSLTGLNPGVYTGGVSYAFSSAAVRTVNVTLIVTAAPSATPSERTSNTELPRATCASTQLVPTQTGLVNNFAQPAAWPTPLSVLLVDNCGNPVPSGQIVATFSNGDPPLALNASSSSSAVYAGTWTPRNSAAQVTIAARATATGFPAATAQITGQVIPNATPLLAQNGTLNVFTPVLGAPVAPGTIVQIYGSNLTSQVAQATTIPLPASLNQTTVLIGGVQAPLYYVSPGQINAQVPFELAAGKPYQVIVNANGALSTPNSIQLAADAPGIAQFQAGQIIAQHLDGSLVLDTAPAKPGEIIVFYVAGMGLTNQTVPSGTPSPSTNLALPLDTPTITLNGVAVPASDILFAGLTPTLVGLYQVDFKVPPTTPNGDIVLVLTQTSGQSGSTVLPVHN